jgi:hypothetical protein
MSFLAFACPPSKSYEPCNQHCNLSLTLLLLPSAFYPFVATEIRQDSICGYCPFSFSCILSESSVSFDLTLVLLFSRFYCARFLHQFPESHTPCIKPQHFSLRPQSFSSCSNHNFCSSPNTHPIASINLLSHHYVFSNALSRHQSQVD